MIKKDKSKIFVLKQKSDEIYIDHTIFTNGMARVLAESMTVLASTMGKEDFLDLLEELTHMALDAADDRLEDARRTTRIIREDADCDG